MIGIVFALTYTFLGAGLLQKISNKVVRGAILGFVVFVFAQIMMAVLGAIMGGMMKPEGSMMLVILGSIIGHIVYGIVTVALIKEPASK